MNTDKLIAEIIAVGDEVLSGRVINTNAAFLSKELEKIGFLVKYQQVVSDEKDAITVALRLAASRSNVIVFCGGLGPTEDDLTKETVAEAFGRQLVLDETVLEEIEAFFLSRGIVMSDNNRKQAMVPEGCKVLHNSNGTAPGLILQKGKQAVVLLPGPPSELRPLFLDAASPILKEMNDNHILSCSLMVTGISESSLESMTKELLYGDNPHSALYAADGQIEIHITAIGSSEDETKAFLDEKVNAFTAVLGDHIYAKDKISLSESVVAELIDKGKTVSVAESCTGGMMAQQITAVPGSSACFEFGVASYADWTKHTYLDVEQSLLDSYSAVSSVVAVEMARGVRAKGKADYGVGITGIAGPGVGNYLDKEVGLVYIAVCDKKKAIVREFRFGDKRSRDNIRVLSCVNAFDMLRRFINDLPVKDGEEFNRFQIADLKRKSSPKTKAGIFAKKTVAIVLSLSALIGSSIYGANTANAAADRGVYTSLKEEYVSRAEEDPEGALLALREGNEDTIGWVSDVDQDISTVFVTEHERYYYDDHDYLKRNNVYGCARAPFGTPLNGIADNIVIQASKEGNGILFSSLPSYLQQDYASKHRYFYLTTEQNTGTFEVFSVLFLDSAEGIDGYLLTPFFRDEVAFQQFVISTKMRSIYSTDLPLNLNDQFLTLVCPMDEMWTGCRLVVVAKKVYERDALRPTTLSINGSVLYPNAWYKKNGIECGVNIPAESDRWLDWYRQGGKVGQALSEADHHIDPKIRVTMNGEELVDTPLEIVSRIVTNEAPDITNAETIKAIAVAVSSGLKYEFNNGNHSPEVTGRAASDRVRDVVREILDETLVFEDSPCWTPVFYCSNGKTNDASEMIDGSFPYLVTVESEYDRKDWNSGYYKETDFSTDLFRSRVEALYGISLSDDPSNWIQILNTTSIGTVTRVSIDGQVEEDGYKFFVDVLALPSANVTVSLNNRNFRFTIYGTGYGLGMSIVGAKYYVSQEGWTYDQVLQHYYPATVINNIPWDEYYAGNIDAKKD